MEYFKLAIVAIFVSNFVLAQFLGLCPFIGVSRRSSDAMGMGFAVIFVMTMASAVTFIVYKGVLVPGSPVFAGDYRYLNIVVFILVIASLVQLVEMIMEKVAPSLYQALGIYLPLITTNCSALRSSTSACSSGWPSGRGSSGRRSTGSSRGSASCWRWC